MTERDKELNELMAKRLLADIAASTVMEKHLEGKTVGIKGAFHGPGEQTGAGGWLRQKH